MTMLVNRAIAAAVTGLQYLLLFEAVLLSAVVLYGALYWLVMPLRLHDKPIFLDYSDRATTGSATGTVDFLARHTQWDPSPLTNVERLNTKVLKAGQHYKVGLELQMPTSYINRRIGVFMVHTTLLDEQDNELASSARPAMLPHTSALRKGVGMMFAWPLHLAGLRREEETIYVDCIDYYEENALHPLTKARVTVSSGRVQFYSSSINITPQVPEGELLRLIRQSFPSFPFPVGYLSLESCWTDSATDARQPFLHAQIQIPCPLATKKSIGGGVSVEYSD
ncbi:conserved unknown protein [Ectocarpus siliculosus]|uniref:Uncharacterized protein n=1 Tax=Ectocarpus siliculosus TaxID=2880 RepID=D7G4V6_ECTSI|nr:conserved unknown protein [Ectocarpus siliculosus]|eukprot:CBJ27199.1 conserved unknown protein [Ectocarpus siliculosus]